MTDDKRAKLKAQGDRTGEPPAPTVADGDIEVVAIDRRSFLSRIGVRSATLAGLVVLSASCGSRSSDTCDADNGTDTDPRDRPGAGRNDRCDTD